MKNWSKHGVLLAIEDSYGSATPALVNTTDGFLAAESPEAESTYQHDGAREGRSAGGFAALGRMEATGLGIACDLAHYFRGSTPTPYSASVKSTVHNALRLLGMSASFTTVPTPQWVYQMLSEGYPSAHGAIYSMGERQLIRGVQMARLEIAAQGTAVPRWTFGLRGIGSALPTDVAVPAITYLNDGIASPKAVNLNLLMGSFKGKVEEFTLSIEREIEEITDQNDANGAHGGFVLGAATVKLDCVVQATTLTGTPFHTATLLDPYTLYQLGSKLTTELTCGSAQYNKWKAKGFYGQFLEVPRRVKGDGGVKGRWELSMGFMPGNDSAETDFTITTD